eukprot:5210354-Pleurochrysis_carterae.AAC.2
MQALHSGRRPCRHTPRDASLRPRCACPSGDWPAASCSPPRAPPLPPPPAHSREPPPADARKCQPAAPGQSTPMKDDCSRPNAFWSFATYSKLLS